MPIKIYVKKDNVPKEIPKEYNSIHSLRFMTDFNYYFSAGYKIIVMDENKHIYFDSKFPVEYRTTGMVRINDLNDKYFRLVGHPIVQHRIYFKDDKAQKLVGHKYPSISEESYLFFKNALLANQDLQDRYSVSYALISNVFVSGKDSIDESNLGLFQCRFPLACFRRFLEYSAENKKDIGFADKSPFWRVYCSGSGRTSRYEINCYGERKLSQKERNFIADVGLCYIPEIENEFVAEEIDRFKEMIIAKDLDTGWVGLVSRNKYAKRK